MSLTQSYPLTKLEQNSASETQYLLLDEAIIFLLFTFVTTFWVLRIYIFNILWYKLFNIGRLFEYRLRLFQFLKELHTIMYRMYKYV